MNRVTIEEQETMGLRRSGAAAQPEPQVREEIQRVVAQRPQPELQVKEQIQQVVAQRQRGEIMPQINDYSVSVVPTATASVDFRTSAQDRAWGFLIASTPRTFVFALGLTLIAMLATDIGVVAGIVMLISVFSVVELASYIFTLAISAEGTAHMEAKRKWDVIEQEQRERWAHYKRLTEGD